MQCSSQLNTLSDVRHARRYSDSGQLAFQVNGRGATLECPVSFTEFAPDAFRGFVFYEMSLNSELSREEAVLLLFFFCRLQTASDADHPQRCTAGANGHVVAGV